MKASDLIAAIEEACLRPLLVEVALRERKQLEQHEQRHLQAFEDGLHRTCRQYDPNVVDNDNDNDHGCVQHSLEGDGRGQIGEGRSTTTRDIGSSMKTAPTPPSSNQADPTRFSKARAASPKKAATTATHVAKTKSSHTGSSEHDETRKRTYKKKEASLKDETWEQVRYSSLLAVPGFVEYSRDTMKARVVEIEENRPMRSGMISLPFTRLILVSPCCWGPCRLLRCSYWRGRRPSRPAR
jgi:hypothetical protein